MSVRRVLLVGAAPVKFVHNPAAFSTGNIVKVVRKAARATGWEDDWNDESMDPTLGKTGTIILSDKRGCKVKFEDGMTWYYPSCALELSLGGGNVAIQMTRAQDPVSNPAPAVVKKKRVRVKPDGPWDAAPCTHLRWNLMGFFREKLAIQKAVTTVTLKDGTTQEVSLEQVDIACTKCKTTMTLKAK